jgi:hypothetical protein
MEGIQKAQLEIENSLHNTNDKGSSIVWATVSSAIFSMIILYQASSDIRAIRSRRAFSHLSSSDGVDSLYTVIERAGLEVTFLTLEPIAALNVAIPKDLRC